MSDKKHANNRKGKLKQDNIRKREKAYMDRLTELIVAGGLSDFEKLQADIKKEFSDQCGNLSSKKFREKVMGIVWSKKTLENLENCLKFDMSVETFREYHSYIPLNLIDQKSKELRGRSVAVNPVRFKRGLATLLDETSTRKDEFFKLPETTFSNPFKIVTKDKHCWSISTPNAPSIGTVYNPIMRENPLRKAFADAEHRGDDAIFLANTIYFNVTKASGAATKIHRSLFTGLNINLDIIDPDYRSTAERILKNAPKDEVIYETIAESFQNIISGLNKILHPDGTRQYSGMIYVVLTRQEEDLIAKIAYMEERYPTLVRIAQLNQEKRMGNTSQALSKELARTIISLIHSQEDRRFYNRVRAFVVRAIEKALGPNCKVIGQGTTYVKINDCIGELNIPSKTKVSDEDLANYVDGFGAKSYRRQMPDFVVVMPQNPLGFKTTERERYVEGKRLMPSKIFVAPPLVDGKFLREALRNTVRQVHELAKVVKNNQFNPGLLRLEYSNKDINPVVLSMDAVASHERIKQVKDSRETYNGKFWVLVTGTDPHWGGRSKVFIKDEQNRRKLGTTEAVMEMMRRGGLFKSGNMRAHCFNMNDDATQARNFDTQYEPSPHQMPYHEIEKKKAQIDIQIERCNNPSKIKELMKQKDELMEFQLGIRGTDYPKHQLHEVYHRHVEANIDFFHALLSRVKESGIYYKGLSEITGLYDTRDIGAVNYGTGNHFAHTVWGALTEGDLIAEKVRDRLLAHDQVWRDNPEYVKKHVRAPIFSSEFFGLGRIVMPGGYEYGLDFRGTPPRFATWSDALLGWVRNDIFAGDMEGHMSGYFSIGTCGDKHFFASAALDYKFYHMGASGSHTDQYGKRGFSPNNTGVSFLLMPVDGPENGPILIRTLSATYIQNYFKDPFNINWEELLPNVI